MDEKKKFAVYFNLFYYEIWRRLCAIEDLWADVKSVTKVWQITWDDAVWPCYLLKVVYTIKPWFEEKKVKRDVEEISRRKDFYMYADWE